LPDSGEAPRSVWYRNRHRPHQPWRQL